MGNPNVHDVPGSGFAVSSTDHRVAVGSHLVGTGNGGAHARADDDA